MPTKSISAHLGSTYSLKHNNREIMCANVDARRSCNNHYIIRSGGYNADGYRFATIEEIYDKVFEPSWREFQSKQRPCRRYTGTYLEWIREQKFKARTKTTDSRYKDKAINEAYEVVFQIGNMDDTGYADAPTDAIKAERIMEQVAEHICSLPYVCVITKKELSDENWKPPDTACLILLNHTLHMDEAVCGLHCTFIPVCNSARGSKKQALLKKCFEQLGYPTSFSEITDRNGNRIPKVNKENQTRVDANGNIIYKKAVTQKGALDWLDELKDWCAVRMKEEYGWDRKATVGNGRKHLDIEDYKVYRAKERQQELEDTIRETETASSDAVLQSAVELFNGQQEDEKMQNMNVAELWQQYNSVSDEFWKWYREQSNDIKEQLANAKDELDYYKKKQRYYDEVANRSVWLIRIIIKLISKALFGHQRDMYAVKVNNLIEAREGLKIISKQMSSHNALTRRRLKEQQCDKDLIEALQTTEQQLREDYEKHLFEQVHRR